MSVPTFFGGGSWVQGTADVSPAWPAGHAADDIGILVVQSCNQAVAAPAGWTECPSSPQGTGTAGAIGSTRLTLFWRRATSAAEASPTVADSGDHNRARILVFRGCETSGSPFDTSAGNTQDTADIAVAIPGGTTTVAECLVLAFVANGTDTTANQTASNGFANADLANVTRVCTGNAASGNGGGVDASSGEKATAGAFGSTTVTLNTSSLQGKIMLALKPPSGGGGGGVTPTNGGLWVATGVKATAGVVSATTATLDTSSAQGRIFIALKPFVTPPANTPPVLAAISDKNIPANVAFAFPLDVTDAEGDPITLTLLAGETDVPAGAEVLQDPDDQSWSFEWTPTGEQAGEWNMVVEASDGTDTSSRSFTITVVGGGGGSNPPAGGRATGALGSIA